MPQNRGDVHLCDNWVKMSSGEPFLIVEDGDQDNEMIIFGTDNKMNLLCEAETIYVDETFHTCPRLFYQIFTIHTFQFGSYNLFFPTKQN